MRFPLVTVSEEGDGVWVWICSTHGYSVSCTRSRERAIAEAAEHIIMDHVGFTTLACA